MKNTVEAIKADELNGLVAKLTHELNTPITILKANLEMLSVCLKDQCKSEVEEELLAMNVQIDRLEYIVKSFKELQKQPLQLAKINLYESINNSLKLIDKRYKASNPKIMLTIHKSKVVSDFNIQADGKKLELVWFKLVSNALDAYIEKAIEEKVVAIELYQTANEIGVTIQDYAGGIDKEVLKNIFKPFVTTKLHKGFGLSIYLVKEILKEQGFVISIDTFKNSTSINISKPL